MWLCISESFSLLRPRLIFAVCLPLFHPNLLCRDVGHNQEAKRSKRKDPTCDATQSEPEMLFVLTF